MHFFEKKGQRFQYQPKRKLPLGPTTPPSAPTAPVEPPKLHSFLPERRPSIEERDRSADTIVASGNRQLKDQGAIPKQRSPSVTETTKQPQGKRVDIGLISLKDA